MVRTEDKMFYVNRSIIKDVLDFIEEHIKEELNLNRLAEYASFSENHFIREFLYYTGMTPMSYVCYRKVMVAATELLEKNIRITDLAYEYNFNSQDSFIRAFKRYLGITPGLFREQREFQVTEPFFLSTRIYYEHWRKKNKFNDMTEKGYGWDNIAYINRKYRSLYPREFYQKLHNMGLGAEGQVNVDIATGTGLLPINLCMYGGEYLGVDISRCMIEEAEKYSDGIDNISFLCHDAHNLPIETDSIDNITASQCWAYFDKTVLVPEIKRVLKDKGCLYVTYLTWLNENQVVDTTFSIIKKHNPDWNSFMQRTTKETPVWSDRELSMVEFVARDINISFSKESWCGAVFASRGVGVSMEKEKANQLIEEVFNHIEEDDFVVPFEMVIMKFERRRHG